jgi:phosphopantothenoylcysteine decarboxylase/phosphopantothenate--cysteine ligase
VIIKAAAVGDYKVKKYSDRKIKKGSAEGLTLELQQNPDIASLVGERKRRGQILAGFAAETEDLKENALKKITQKKLDLVIANDVSEEGAGFASDANRVEIYFARSFRKNPQTIAGDKWEVASGILDAISSLPPMK